jgi:hypothetical protein
MRTTATKRDERNALRDSTATLRLKAGIVELEETYIAKQRLRNTFPKK